MQIVDLRVNFKFSPLSKMFISQARQLFYRTIKSCEHHFYASQSIYTQNFKEYSSLLLTCWWPGRDWGWERTWPAWSTCTAETITSIWCFIRSWCNLLIFFFLTHEIIWKTKRKKGIGTDFTESHKSRETLTNNYLLYFIPKKKDILSKLNLKISLSKIKKKIYVLRF